MSPQLFRIFAIFILAYLIFRILTSWILPMIARWYINRFRKRFYEENPGARKAPERRKKGDLHVTYTGETTSGATDELGEYVDFEEIKDDK